MPSLNSIVVFTDLSPASAEAVRAAHAVARQSHAALEVLRVVTEPLAADWTSELSTAGMPAVQEAIESEAHEWLERVLGETDMVGVDLDVEMGDAAGEIARYAEKQRPDLVVIGAPARDDAGGLVEIARRLVGSTRCSVLVVRSFA